MALHCTLADTKRRADDETHFNAEVDEFNKYAAQYSSAIYAVTVGSEALYRYQQYKKTGGPPAGLNATTLVQRITSFKDKSKFGGKVGTADSWNVFQDGTADDVIGNVGIL